MHYREKGVMAEDCRRCERTRRAREGVAVLEKTVWQNSFTNSFMYGLERETRERVVKSYFSFNFTSLLSFMKA